MYSLNQKSIDTLDDNKWLDGEVIDVLLRLSLGSTNAISES